MTSNLILWPAVAMALLVFVVWLRMYYERVRQMKRDRIHPQAVATSAASAQRLTDSRAADNFRNLFELPVLFYAALFVAHASAQVSLVTLGLAWGFVGLRVMHSAIQCSYNRVMHRFYVYLAGGVLLWSLWAVLGWGLWTSR